MSHSDLKIFISEVLLTIYIKFGNICRKRLASVSYIDEIPLEDSTGRLREIYEKELASNGFIHNFTSLMSFRPEVIDAWDELKKRIRSHMHLRRYELVTLAAAQAIGCVY